MKEFPHRYYKVEEKLKQSGSSSTFVVKPHFGSQNSLLLKLYTGTSTRTKLNSLEENLRWQRGLIHPHLLEVVAAGASGKSSLFTIRQFVTDKLELSSFNRLYLTHLLDSISFLHRQGKIHGHIKPSNLFLIDGNLRLADMRLVESAEYSDLEDIRFAAPELLLGKSPTIESDYYSLGAILYRIYGKRDPFDDSILENLKEKYLHAKIPSIRNFESVREPVAKVIDGLLHRNPRNRVAAFGELLRETPFDAKSVSRTPLMGRREILDTLHSQVSSTLTKSLTVVMIEGDAGIGKSRLIEELQFKSALHNAAFIVTGCIGQSEPNLAPIVRLIRSVLIQQCAAKHTSIGTLLGSYENSLAHLFQDFGDQVVRDGIEYPNERIVQDLIGLVSVLSRNDSLRLCVENIDYAEPATRDFVRQLCYRASELNVRLVLTCRSSTAAKVSSEIEALIGQDLARIVLDPLTRSDSLELVRCIEPHTGKQKEILSRTGGNPLWLLEQAKKEDSQALADAINTQIRQAADIDLQRLLHVLAVKGDPATVDFLARVRFLDKLPIRQKLINLKMMGAVRELSDGYDIRLEGLRTSIEAEISPRERRRIHESIYEALSTEKHVALERLAHHAFNGHLWEIASEHFVSLVRFATKRGDNVASLDYFARLSYLSQKLKKELSLELQCEFAICLARTGKPKRAEQIFELLLTNSDIDEDLRVRLALLAKSSETSSRLDRRLNFLQQAIRSSKYGQEHASILLSRLCNACITAGDFFGAADSLHRARYLLKMHPNTKAEVLIRASEGFLLMNRGFFLEASEVYRTLPCETWSMSAAILTNRGVCLEHLGSIRTAIALQSRAYRLATKAGHLFARLQCLANLGAFKVKLGEFKDGHLCFDETKQLALQIYRITGIATKGIVAEQASLNLLEGRYEAALRDLRSALNSDSLFKRERLQLQLLERDIQMSMGMVIKSSDIERIASEGSWSDSPLYAVQLALLRSRTLQIPDEALACLDEALETARKSSLLYEVCRLEIEKTDRLHELDPDAAKSHSDEALRISKKNGYRPLQCRALLLRALCSKHDKEKEHYLELCFKLATSLGIPEIVSESSYHLGVLHESNNQTVACREYFANSTRITSEIADQCPARYRSAYLAKTWRRDARRRYEKHLLDQPIRMNLPEPDMSGRDHRYFRALYQISIAASSSRTTNEFLRVLLPATGLAREGVVAMLTLEGHTSWNSHGVALTDALRHRVESVAVKARGQARFNSNDRWIPFRSPQFSGGICILSRKRNQMAEEELEFFTIVGIFASSALDQIHNRTLTTPVSPAVDAFHGIVGNSRPIRDLCAHISRISDNTATVLIQGETGTGKELVARAIHRLSSRSKGPFIPIDCGAIPEGLLESELFGSKRGSFTGAIVDRPGVFEAAHTGTLFLDEVSNMNLAMQAKLLRVLQEREIRRVGETRNRPVDVRLVAASNTNLKQLVVEGSFRQDLLFRLNVIDVSIPPLRARREDIPMLASYFLKQLNSSQKSNKVFAPRALEPLMTHGFPGNVRELQNSVERGFFSASGQSILSIPVETSSGDDVVNEARKWLSDLADGRRNFWTEIRDRYRSRDIPREKVVALIDLGLRTTRGSYKDLASLLHIDKREYRRLMDFLRRNNCLLDFRPYRKAASLS